MGSAPLVSHRRFALLRAAVGVALAVSFLAADARAAAPVAGGRYITTVNVGSSPVHVDVRLANDGGEFAELSSVYAFLECGRTPAVTLSSSGLGRRGVRIGTDGRFRAGRSGNHVRGRFVKRGRLAVGRFVLRAAGCPAVRGSFRARLIGRPNAPRPGRPSACDPVVDRPGQLGGEEYRPFEQGVGCTAAREFTRRWHASRACRALTAGGSCLVAGARCEPIRGGALQPLAGIRCRPENQPQAVVELVHLEPCRPPRVPAFSMDLWAINLECATATAFPVLELIGDREGLEDAGPCGTALAFLDRTVICRSVGGFTCRVRPGDFNPNVGFLARCLRDGDAATGIEFAYDFG
jgi:hypothetical protein